MQSYSITSIKYLDAPELYRWIKQGFATSSHLPFQVIDVRGSDYIGGHIVGGWNYPYSRISHDLEQLNALKDRLLTECDGDVINCVFHCAQSQQRGPSAAMKFLRSLPEEQLGKFQIWVLRGGFNYWQSAYGKDASVTEGYAEDIWRY